MNPAILRSHAFGKALSDAGIIPAENVRRVTIVADATEPLRIYVDLFGAEPLADLAVKHAAGAEVIERPVETINSLKVRLNDVLYKLRERGLDYEVYPPRAETT